MATFYIKEDDTAPTIQAQLKNPDGTPVDLTATDVDIRITKARGGDNVVNSTASIQNASDGVVRYTLQASDTEDSGRYRVEFEVTYGTGQVETFPNKGYHTLLIGRNMEV